MVGSDSGSLMRMQSHCQLGLCHQKALLGWGQSLTRGCLTWLRAGGLVPPHSAGLLDCAYDTAPCFPHSKGSERKKEKEVAGSHGDFYNLGSKVAHHAD